MWTVKEKQADTGKHNAFKGAPVQISPSEAKHKASVVSAGLDSDFNLKKVQMACAILDFAPCKGADEQVHMGGKVLGQKKSARQTTIPFQWS